MKLAYCMYGVVGGIVGFGDLFGVGCTVYSMVSGRERICRCAGL